MAYTPTNWKDRDVENPRTYTARQNEDGSITFFDAPGEIREQGTPVDSANMNKIEQGIVDAHVDLTNKANIDADNLSANGKSLISGLGMPSERYINLTIGASPTQFTAPANGWFDIWAQGGTTSNNKYLEIINNTTGISQGVYGTSNYHYKCHLPARKGDKVSVQYNNMEAAPDRCRFIYAEGEE